MYLLPYHYRLSYTHITAYFPSHFHSPSIFNAVYVKNKSNQKRSDGIDTAVPFRFVSFPFLPFSTQLPFPSIPFSFQLILYYIKIALT